MILYQIIRTGIITCHNLLDVLNTGDVFYSSFMARDSIRADEMIFGEEKVQNKEVTLN